MKIKNIIGTAALISTLLAAVLAAIGGVMRWEIAAALIAVLCCVPVFTAFERRAPSARELVLIAVMTAFSAAGRFIFAAVPFFKPVTAVVVLSAMYFGRQAGFMVGALSAVVSNIYFGQGAWTPFQMFSWGFIGWTAGLLNGKRLLEKPVILCVFGVFAGALYSVIMEIWTTLSADGALSPVRWGASMIAALPVTLVYCVSNAVFLLLLRKPVGKRLERLKTKFGVFDDI
ncbi:MAG: ECF transporter S component [Oscillospiraceae bacterium]|nr:ECF transporter S component [Oscillospiraceae bacterium]